ncbi:MutS-related protein [Pedobacter cryophilus]|uniref:DNA mismatch repair protein MutS n=1 Tax=Pedobacter cryophilus TaxID=2571271 RepID=A0A4U1CAF8_9SPHI|nr:DNA mismatch repair protein MutS [Pedobacter cryophilus]TKC00678.1 DNA mismatch repair protein MutS [Pedobacter cryophilus]
MNLSQEKLFVTYQSNITTLQQLIAKHQKKINTYSFLRLGVFLLTILLVFLLFSLGALALIMVAIVMISLFLWIVAKQAKQQEQLDFDLNKQLLLQNELNILNDKHNIYDAGLAFENPRHAYTDDLDIFGERSLFAYLNRTATPQGNEILASWLKNADAKDQILDRQEAIKELANHQEENLNLRVQLYPLKGAVLSQLKENIKDKLPAITQFITLPYINFIIYFLPAVSFSLLIAASIFNGVWWSFLGLSLLINYVVYAFHLKHINLAHLLFSKSASQLKTFAKVIKPIEEQPWKSKELKFIVEKIKNNSGQATHQQIQSLAKIIQDFDARLNVFVGTFLNLFLFWDLRVVKRLHQWQQKSSGTIINSFKTIAEFEALISLANLDVNHPHWVYPEVVDAYSFETKAMGHPLIPDSVRINNDFKFSNERTIDVITGSNMAGKSTFLRTVGINMVLAYAGSKVCAKQFKTGVFSLVSYMRIKDSLMDQTSTFKAELDRLKMILALTAKQENTFILVDEMLRGTNSKDKYLGTKVFIEKLLLQQTPGLIATHDLQIADLEKEHPTKVRNFHFDITMNHDEMFFDYLIKDGECKTFNAAILLKAIGLSLDNNVS